MLAVRREDGTVAATPEALRGDRAREVTRAPGESIEQSAAFSQAVSVVLHAEEANRARVFFRLMIVISLGTAAFMPFVSGPWLVRGVVLGACLLGTILAISTVRAIRDESRYTPSFVIKVGIACIVLSEITLLYFGLFSAGAMILPLGVYFFGLTENERVARLVNIVGASFFGVLSIGVSIGWLPDAGPIPVSSLSVPWRVFFIIMIQGVFAVTHFFARSSRVSTAHAIEQLNHVRTELSARDAQLAEAKGELDRALAKGEGRYTGESIEGYRLSGVLGRGGMGEVYRAEHSESGKVAAIKLLHPNVLADPSQVQRFIREAKIAASVRSPFVAEVYSSGLTPSETPFVIMELLEGKDLAWHLRQNPRMPLNAVVELVEQASHALVAIREAGIIHRDLKPHNFVLTGKGTNPGKRIWKILDFGVSRFEAAGSTITQGAIIGTPSYMAPEQVRLEPLDARTDLYGLATVAYRALTGKPAFTGDDVAAVLFNVVGTAPLAPSLMADIPEDIELVLSLGMAKSRDDRFATVEAFSQAFQLASIGDLDAPTRERARKLLQRQPWNRTRNVESEAKD